MNIIKYITIILICLLTNTKGIAQDLNKKVLDEKSKTEILLGYCNREGIMSGEFGNSYDTEWNTYKPKDEVVNQLKNKLDDINFTIVFGAWCGDSKEQVPRFIRLLDCLKYDVDKVTFIAVDRSKTATGVKTADLNIEKVPTFIMYRNNKEIGRIIETPTESLEKDLLGIISKK